MSKVDTVPALTLAQAEVKQPVPLAEKWQPSPAPFTRGHSLTRKCNLFKIPGIVWKQELKVIAIFSQTAFSLIEEQDLLLCLYIFNYKNNTCLL